MGGEYMRMMMCGEAFANLKAKGLLVCFHMPGETQEKDATVYSENSSNEGLVSL